MTQLQAMEAHLHCVLNGIAAAKRGDHVELMLEAAEHQALCALDACRRAIASASFTADIKATKTRSDNE